MPNQVGPRLLRCKADTKAPDERGANDGGSPAGGAELFFERLTIALAAAGDTVLPVIRRDAGRAARLRAAGLEPAELGFGNPLDLLTGPRLARTLRRFAPRVAVAWMNRAARFAPRGDWVLAGGWAATTTSPITGAATT